MQQSQQSKSWFDLHNKHITASRFGDVLADPSTKRYKTYMNETIDYILGMPYVEKDAPWFRHGKLWEAQARGLYELKTGNKVIQDFFFTHPKLPYVGCSPDGFVTPNINIEIKCHKGIPDDLQPRIKLPSNHKPQVQGQMWCCPERTVTHFVDFYKEETTGLSDLIILHVEPDKEYFQKLEESCVSFWQEIQKRLK